MGNAISFSFRCCDNAVIKNNKELNKSNKRLSELNNNLDRELYNYSKKNDIIIIPLLRDYNLDNLYPIKDEVHKWNTFIIGNDKTYILVKNEDFKIDAENVLNTKGTNGMDIIIFEFLDKIWNKTLQGHQIQIFIYTLNTLYLLNSYALYNNNKNIIGAMCVIRNAGLINKKIFDYDNFDFAIDDKNNENKNK